MKATYPFLFVLAFAVLLSCGKDDDNNKTSLSSAKQITGFVFNTAENDVLDENITATVNENNKTITARVPYGTDVTSLMPTIEVSEGAIISPGGVQDFSSEVTYTVTAENGTKTTYQVTINIEEENPSEPGEPSLVSEITQYGITWTFNEPETVGQFVTGDYWVLDDGDVTIKSVSPSPENGRNGSLLNPVSGGAHPFDDRVRAGYDAGLAAEFPLAVVTGDALVSTISRGDETTDWAGDNIDSKVQVQTAAVLTILNDIPPANAFRPSYMDRSQTIYTTDQINESVIPNIPTSGINITKDISYYERGLQRPWMLFVHEWPGRDSHPHQNMKGYHQYIGEFLSEATLMLLMDIPEKETLVNYYIQLGIDYYYSGATGEGDGSYYVAPVIVTGLFLNEDTIKNVFINDQIQAVPRDYADFYFYEDRNDNTTSDIVPPGETYAGHPVFFRNNLATNRGYEHLHPTEWDKTAEGESEALKDENYRTGQDTHQHVGMVLAASILGLKAEWNHDATFMMMSRWMICADIEAEEAMGAGNAVKSSKSDFVDSVFDQYWPESEIYCE